MNFQTAIKSCFNKYVTFSGRAPRSEYWYFGLFYVLASIVAAIVDHAVLNMDSSPLSIIIWLACILPSLAVSFRRLHDVNKSAWWLFFFLVPIVGPIMMIVWFCTRGTAGDNRFGSDPLA